MKTVLVLAASLFAAGAAAQSDGRRNPTDPQAAVPPVEYRSAFSGYQPFREPDLADWRRVNDEMKGLGGHQGHTERAKPPAAPGGQAPQRAAPGGHGGHK